MGTVRGFFNRLLRADIKAITQTGLVGIFLAGGGYCFKYLDRLSDQRDGAWKDLRTVISYVDASGYRWGNFNQTAAIETLTKHCELWREKSWLASFYKIAFPNCDELKSLSLQRMELGGLKAVAANFSHSNLSCSNLATAKLRMTNLSGADLHGASLAGADLRGADLTGVLDYRLANLSWAILDNDTKFDVATLKCGCVEQGARLQTISGGAIGPTNLKICPVGNNCLPETLRDWTCAQ